MRRALGVVIVAAAAACTFDGLDGYTSGSDAAAGDGGADVAPGDAPSDQSADVASSDAPVAAACNLSAPFGNIGPVTSLDTSFIDGQAALSPDELTVYFLSNRLNAGSNVFTASRSTKTAPFGSVAPLASLNVTGADTWNATLTGDALTAYVVTDQGGVDHMYVAKRASSLVAFGPFNQMPSPIVTGEQPFVRPDGQVLYYTDQTTAPLSIARAALGPSPSVSTVAVAVTGHDVGIPVVNASDTILYFAVFHAGQIDSYDIWMATRPTASAAWSAPSPVTELNTPSFDVPSWISADGCRIYYTHAPPSDASGSWDIYYAERP